MYKQGDFFGEIALLLGEPRKASVYALTDCTCLYISRETFHRVLGPLEDILQSNIEKYSKYQEAVKTAATNSEAIEGKRSSMQADDYAMADKLEVFDCGVSLMRGGTKIVARKRERHKTDFSSMEKLKTTGEVDKEMKSEEDEEPTSLAEKVGQDLRKPELSMPDAALDVGDAQLQMFGGLRLGEKFMVDKQVRARTQVKPCVEGLEAAGSEVREVDKENFRIYRKGTPFPGLTMSRAFGDTACGGVSQEPEYKEILIQPSDEYYAMVASDGIWEFMGPEKVVELSAKKLRLKGPRETLRFLVEASRKRWVYCCGDYCDDITAVIVQWNVKEKDLATNHSLQITRHE